MTKVIFANTENGAETFRKSKRITCLLFLALVMVSPAFAQIIPFPERGNRGERYNNLYTHRRRGACGPAAAWLR